MTHIRQFLLLTLTITALGLFAWGGEALATDWPSDSSLVTCGPDTAVLFAGTTSPDGAYAVGWTLRPRHDNAPVDWSAWVLDRYKWDAEEGDPPYELLNCVIDLRAKRLLVLPSRMPEFPHKNRGYLDVVWGPVRSGQPRFALIQNDARFFTANLWLVRLEATPAAEMSQRDLADTLSKAVTRQLRRRRGARADEYGVILPVHGANWPMRQDTVFKAASVTIPFVADIPKTTEGEVTGVLTVDLNRAKVMGLSTRRAKPKGRRSSSDLTLKPPFGLVPKSVWEREAVMSCLPASTWLSCDPNADRSRRPARLAR